MQSPDNGIRDASPVRRPVLLGLFTGTSVGAGYLLAGIPNVELMTLIAALAGSVLGAGQGFLCGALAACIYSLGSPYGLPVPWILAAQALGMGAAGAAGSWLRPGLLALIRSRRRTGAALAAAGCGILVTAVFEVLTNLAIVVAFSLPPLVVAGGAIPFFLIHVGSNAAVFGIFLPLLLPRLRNLGRPPLLARCLPAVILGWPLLAGGSAARAAVTGAEPQAAPSPALSDSAATADRARTGRVATGPLGWQSPLWDPFVPTALGWLDWQTSWLPVSDGGLGAVARILGDAATSPVPLVLRDGVPLGTGHVLADDSALLPQVGMHPAGSASGLDGWGGTGGLLELTATDPDPRRAVTGYWGSKGPHETYTRNARWLTPAASWRVAFEFEENLDLEGYNYTALPDEVFDPTADEDFPGHARIRLNRTRLTRNLSPAAGLAVQYDYGRKTKDSLPALGAAHQEIWQDGVAVSVRDTRGRLGVLATAYWRNGDVGWGDGPQAVAGAEWRLLETGREGVLCDLFLHDAPATPSAAVSAVRDSLPPAAADSLAAVGAPPAPAGAEADPTVPRPVPRPRTGPLNRLRLAFANWTLEDSGTAEPWAAEYAGPVAADGQLAFVSWRSGLRGHGLRAWGEVAGRWSGTLDWAPGGELRAEQDADRPAWGIYVQEGGRDPRSDELVTPLRHVVDGRELALLPNPGLQREKTRVAGGDVACRLLGTDLAVDVSVTRLTDGITWQASPLDEAQGRWQNGLRLDSTRVRAFVGREGRFLGWARVALEGTWQRFDEITGRAAFLPPARYLRLRLLWENHFFQEDGILQLGLLSTRVGEMADPWDVTRTYGLPARTVHDLIVSFRLVGANVSLAFRNLTDERNQLTSGAAGTGRELDLRLDWSFRH